MHAAVNVPQFVTGSSGGRERHFSGAKVCVTVYIFIARTEVVVCWVSCAQIVWALLSNMLKSPVLSHPAEPSVDKCDINRAHIPPHHFSTGHFTMILGILQ